MKKFFVFTVILALVLALVPATVFATAETDVTAAAAAGGTLTLNSDVVLTANLAVDKDLTIDLAGFTMDLGANRIEVTDGAVLTINNSTGSGKITSTGTAISVVKGTVNANGGVISGSVAVNVKGDATATDAWSTLNVNGASLVGGFWGVVVKAKGAVVNVASGSIAVTENSGAAISGNGTAGSGGTAINISGGTVSGGKNGTTDGQGVGVYHPQDGTLTITGGTISGDMAVSMKSGKLDISGGTLAATGAYVDPATMNTNGTEDTGAAISLTSNANYTGNIDVNITGGTFTSANGNALYEGIAMNGATPAAPATEVQSLKVSGGSFVADDEDRAAVVVNNNTDVKAAITGGEFTDTAAEMAEAGLVPAGTTFFQTTLADGTVVYTFTDPNPKTGDTFVVVCASTLVVICALMFVLKRERNAA